MVNINIPLSDEAHKKLLNYCNETKKALHDHAREKKRIMWECYQYSKGEFIGNDLLPEPSYSLGAENDAKTNRPQIFIPLTRSQLKQLYSQIKLALFPNEGDFFQVVGKTEEAKAIENELTEGFKWIFKEGNLSEKLGKALLNAIWSGNPAAYPMVTRRKRWEWTPQGDGNYTAVEVTDPPQVHVEVLNPIDFYPDPFSESSDTMKWVYCKQKKLQDILDNPDLYYNTEGLRAIASEGRKDNNARKDSLTLSQTNRLNPDLNDPEKYLDYDLYYLDYVDLGTEEEPNLYRNVLVGIAGEEKVIRFHPNLASHSLSPVVHSTWMPDCDSNYGTGPVEDMKEHQRLLNMIWNHVLEKAAREGNKFAVNEDVDMSQMTGAAGGVIRTPGSPRDDVAELGGNLGDVSVLVNAAGLIETQAQVLAGANNPFQGGSQNQFKKTATELSIIDEQGRSISREIVEHLAVDFVQPILERLMYEVADAFPEPVKIRQVSSEGPQYIEVNFSIIKEMKDQFTMEVTSVNQAASKSAQVNGMMQLLQLTQSDERYSAVLRNDGYDLIHLLGQLMGIKNLNKVMMTPGEQVNNNLEESQQARAQTEQVLNMAAQALQQLQAQVQQNQLQQEITARAQVGGVEGLGGQP